MSKQLNLAFEKRQLGDYGHTFVIDEEEAEDLIEIGQTFLAGIHDYFNNVKKG